MIAITIENSTVEMPRQFKSEYELLNCLIEKFEVPVLVGLDYEDLNDEEKAAFLKHKAEGYTDFIDFKG